MMLCLRLSHAHIHRECFSTGKEYAGTTSPHCEISCEDQKDMITSENTKYNSNAECTRGGGADVDVGFLGIVTANLDMCGCTPKTSQK